MSVSYPEFDALKRFVDFTEEDAQNLTGLATIVEEQGPAITDHFYETLGRFDETAKLIEGRVEALKKTHRQYLAELTGGDYGEAYFARRSRIGQVHVARGIDPRFVEAVMSTIRTGMLIAIAREVADPAKAAALSASFIKLCDLDLAIINMAYNEERLDRFSAFTGMSRRLIENVIKMPAK